MERLQFKTPLLIGGATTSGKHTAVKIAPAYSAGTVYVTDASKAVGIVGELMKPDSAGDYLSKLGREQETIRAEFQVASGHKLLPYPAARDKRLSIEWEPAEIAQPELIGTRVLDEVPLTEIIPYIDWTPFFHVWELRGRYPEILEKPEVGETARELFENAQALLEEIVEGKQLQARAVYGFFPASSEGDDIIVFANEKRETELARFHTLRQQQTKREGADYLALADFVAPQSSGVEDYLGVFAVTAGHNLEALVDRFKQDHDDYKAIMSQALADRLAEALAEMLHERARRECGFGKEEVFTKEELIRERYRGIRPAPGYPAAPDHSEKATLFRLLEVEERIGISLTENYAMAPAASISGLYLNHPEARYFAVGKIGEDQVSVYARRKGVSKHETERWLRPNLGYEPGR
jgi:5-methyltetrahydrofolate--homocysteine methyltransferase